MLNFKVILNFSYNITIKIDEYIYFIQFIKDLLFFFLFQN